MVQEAAVAAEAAWRRLCLAVVLFVVLLPRQAFAYRTAADIATFAGTSRVAFAATPMRFQVVAEAPAELDELDVEAAAASAIETWLGPICTARPLSFDGSTLIEATAEDGRNTIQWVFDWENRGFVPGAAALTDVQYVKQTGGEWQIAEADIYLNASLTWSASLALPSTEDGPEVAKDLQAVLTHELGHAAGLLHPCEADGIDGAPNCSEAHAGLCMHPTYSVSQRDLAQDDVNGICFLYPGALCEETGCAEGETCTADGCRPRCGEEVCTKDQVCTERGCLAAEACALTSCIGLPCADDSNCALGELCSSGTCSRGNAPLGDPCKEPSDCFDGACVAKVCAAVCDSVAPCPVAAECDIDAGTCRDSLKALGEACASPLECRGGNCLAEGVRAPVCTRSCVSTACPEGWSCRTVDNTPVCAPVRFKVAGGGGCDFGAARGRRSDPFGGGSLYVSLALACWFFRRARLARLAQS